MRGLPWRSTVKADRKSVVTAFAISLVTAFALVGFALASVLDGEAISPEGRFGHQDLLVWGDAPPEGDLLVRLADVPVASGGSVTLALLTGKLAPDLLPGSLWTTSATSMAPVTFLNGTTVSISSLPASIRIPPTWLLVAPADAARWMPADATGYALFEDPEMDVAADQGVALVPGVEPFLVGSSREVSRDLVLVVLFAAVLVTLFSYEFIRSEIRERRQEIAIWRSLGMRRRHVVALVITRAGAMSAGAAFVGIALCLLFLRAARSVTGIERLSTPSTLATLGVFGAVALAGVLGSIAPAIVAARIQVREAMEGAS